MGRTYMFECEKCDYQARVAGGREEGLEFTVQTILCQECRQLQDSVISWRTPVTTFPNESPDVPPPSAPSFAELVKRLPVNGNVQTRWMDFGPECLASPSHSIRLWTEPDKCPRCGAFMERSTMPFRQWV